jgi:hypothetical protein
MMQSDLPSHLDELQKASDYLMIKKQLRSAAWGSLIFGVIAMGIGTYSIADNPLNGVLVLIGLFLLIEGTWLLKAPKPVGLIVDGIALLIVGVWNIAVTLLNLSAGAKSGGFFPILAVIQIVMGFKSIRRYPRFVGVTSLASNQEILNKTQELINQVNKADEKTSKDIIVFQTKTFTQTLKWTARLADWMGIFSANGGKEVMFLPKDQVSIERKGKVLIGKTLKIGVKLGSKEMTAKMVPEHMERFDSWKLR